MKDELTQEQKRELINDIKTLDQDGLNNLYLIIRYSANCENDENVYGAKYNRKGVIFNLEGLPEILQKTIYCFVKKHLIETQTTSVIIEFE